MSAIVSGLIGAVAAFALVKLAERTQKSATRQLDGWRALRPSWFIHGSMFLFIGLAVVISYLLLNERSNRPEASIPNLIACLLLAGAVWGAIYVGRVNYFRTIFWKGNELHIRPIFGHEIGHRFSDVAKVTNSELSGGYLVIFRDGSRFWFSEHMHGAKDLASRLPKRAFSD